jgi:uncharacterized membrane protein
MPTIERSIDVNVDISTAYDQWARFDTFPEWIEGVASVERRGDDRLHWVAKVRDEFAAFEGETREWDARITEQTRDGRLAWESLGGSPGQKPDSGAAAFKPLGDSACRVTFTMTWEPQGSQETPGEVLAAMNQVVAADLARFKDFIEARAGQACSWRPGVAA